MQLEKFTAMAIGMIVQLCLEKKSLVWAHVSVSESFSAAITEGGGALWPLVGTGYICCES